MNMRTIIRLYVCLTVCPYGKRRSSLSVSPYGCPVVCPLQCKAGQTDVPSFDRVAGHKAVWTVGYPYGRLCMQLPVRLSAPATVCLILQSIICLFN
jgi:hypothetical protein